MRNLVAALFRVELSRDAGDVDDALRALRAELRASGTAELEAGPPGGLDS